MYDSFATPWTVARQAPLLMGFFRQEYWSGLLFFSPGVFPDQELNLCLKHWLYHWAIREANSVELAGCLTLSQPFHTDGLMERTRASIITKNSSRGTWSSWPINKDVDENCWPEEYSAKLGVIRKTSVLQGGFSVDSIQYSAEGGKGREKGGSTLLEHSPPSAWSSWATSPRALCLVWAKWPLCQLVSSALETHLVQALQAAEPELKSQKRKQSAPVFCSQSDRCLRVASTWPTA